MADTRRVDSTGPEIHVENPGERDLDVWTLISSHGLGKTPLASWEGGLIYGSRAATI